MRKRKIRGHNRRHKQVKNWKENNLSLRKDILDNFQSDHIDIVVHPWCDLSLSNSIFPEPNKKTKYKILEALLDIHDSLKKQLDELKISYYLAIWLNEPRFSKSQIVCSVGNKIDFYKNAFQKANEPKQINLNHYSNLKERLEKFEWNHFLDEDHLDNEMLEEPDEDLNGDDYKNWFNKLLKKEHRTYKSNGFEIYSFKRGDVWIGQIEK